MSRCQPGVRTPRRVVAPRRSQRRPGSIFLDREQRLIGVMVFGIVGGQITRISSILNPDKLAHLGPIADLKSL